MSALLLSLRLLLLVSLVTHGLAYMDPLEAGEVENDDGELDENDPTPRGMGMRCGTYNRCAQGYDCIRAPIRRRCYPVECGIQAIRNTIEQTGFDLHGYGQKVMQEAGVGLDSNMFRRFPDMGLNLVNRDSADLQKLQTAIVNDRPPLELFKANFVNCTGADAENTTNPEATVAGIAPYFGMSAELGALATYNMDLFWGQGTADAVGQGFLNNCFGAVLGLDASISGLIGLAFTGRIADLEDGCKQMFPIADFPPFGLQVGLIASESPTFLMEFTGGASASTGLPGFTTCTTTVL